MAAVPAPRRARAALSHTYLLAIIENRFCSDERIHLLLDFLLQISTCPIEAKQAGSLDHEIITRNGDGFFDCSRYGKLIFGRRDHDRLPKRQSGHSAVADKADGAAWHRPKLAISRDLSVPRKES